MRVRVPGSSANLGPGFDAMGLAVNRYFELSDEPVEGFAELPADDFVWTVVGRYVECPDQLWFRTDLPIGQGLGSSAAAVVAAAYVGFRLQGADAATARQSAFSVAAEVEGHPDNAAPSAFGGLNLAAGGQIHTVAPMLDDGQLFIWLPGRVSLTKESRARLSPVVELADVIVQAASCAAIFGGLLTGSWEMMRGGNFDRIHEAGRLRTLPDSAAVVGQLRDAGHVAWLSGSGPGIAALIESDGEQFVPVAPGEWLALRVDLDGCVEME